MFASICDCSDPKRHSSSHRPFYIGNEKVRRLMRIQRYTSNLLVRKASAFQIKMMDLACESSQIHSNRRRRLGDFVC